MQLRYHVRVQQVGAEQFTVHIPALPGCFTCGNTRKQAVRIARDLIESYLQHLALRGRSIPVDGEIATEPSDSIEVVSVHAPLAVIA